MTAAGTKGDQRRREARERAKLYKVDACQATRCGRAAIRWVPTDTGNPIPLDAGRDPGGPIVLDQDPATKKWLARAMRDDDRPDRPRYSVHWSTCHEPGLYRAVKLAADPRGELPSLNSRMPPPARLPTCHGCATPCTFVLGFLCLACSRAAFARWSPDMAQTVAAMPDDLRQLLCVSDIPDGG
jgi:hypothetical protein